MCDFPYRAKIENPMERKRKTRRIHSRINSNGYVAGFRAQRGYVTLSRNWKKKKPKSHPRDYSVVIWSSYHDVGERVDSRSGKVWRTASATEWKTGLLLKKLCGITWHAETEDPIVARDRIVGGAGDEVGDPGE